MKSSLKPLAVILSALMTSSLAFALPREGIFDDFFDRAPRKTVSKFHPRLPIDSECEKLLNATETRMGRELTSEEIVRIMPRILEKTGEALMTAPSVPAIFEPTDKKFFGREALVLTTTGYKLISQIGGDDVIASVDLATGDLRPNKINTLANDRNLEFATFMIEDRRIEVTIAVEILDVMGGGFHRLENIGRQTKLALSPDVPLTHVEFEPISIGTLEKVEGLKDGFNIDVRDEPYNYIVEGLVIKNRW